MSDEGIKPWEEDEQCGINFNVLRREGRDEARQDATTGRLNDDEMRGTTTRCSAMTWCGDAMGMGWRQQGEERQCNNQPNKQTNGRMNKQSGRRQRGKRWRCGARGWRRRILCHAIPLPWNIVVVVVCCVVFGRMTVMEMRWAKKVSNSDCLNSSDVYGYLYFDLVRYMKCTFSLSLAFGRFLYGLFLYIKWLYFESQFFQVKYVRETIQ